MTVKKIITGCISIIILTIVFILLYSGGEVARIDQIFSPFIFALTAVTSVLIPHARKILLVTSLSLLSAMILTYLLNMIDVANWLGSLGFGIILVVSVTYLPQFIKKGYIEKY